MIDRDERASPGPGARGVATSHGRLLVLALNHLVVLPVLQVRRQLRVARLLRAVLGGVALQVEQRAADQSVYKKTMLDADWSTALRGACLSFPG